MLSRIKKLDVSGLFFTQWQPDLDQYSVFQQSAQVQINYGWAHFKVIVMIHLNNAIWHWLSGSKRNIYPGFVTLQGWHKWLTFWYITVCGPFKVGVLKKGWKTGHFKITRKVTSSILLFVSCDCLRFFLGGRHFWIAQLIVMSWNRFC